MRSSELLAFMAAALGASVGWQSPASAQEKAQGFGVDRLYASAPSGGWVVMDALDMRGGLGGAMAMSLVYAHNPLRIRTSDGSQRLAVVTDQAFTNFGFAASYDRWRAYLDMSVPIAIEGQSGTVGGYEFAGPSVDPNTHPDILSDARIGLDARLVGGPRSAFRVGASAQLFVPNGKREEYHTDGSYRAMGRALVAGDLGLFTYAGQLGVHVRPLDDSPTPGSPQGSELLFGVAGGAKMPVFGVGTTALIVGPEIYGASAFRSFLGSSSTAVEGLLTGRLEGTADDGPQLRVKLGAGAGLNQHFGAPDFRFVFAIEVFDHHADRDQDGISDSKDACPDTPGTRTTDPKTNGCPVDRDGDGIPDVEDACPDQPGPATTDPTTTGCVTPANDDHTKR